MTKNPNLSDDIDDENSIENIEVLQNATRLEKEESMRYRIEFFNAALAYLPYAFYVYEVL
jgi:hypothetical protein